MIASAPEMTDMQMRVSEMLGTQSLTEIERFVAELEDYGIHDEEGIDDAYYGCYPSETNFAEDLCEDIYSVEISNMPTFLQTAIDYELVWHQSLKYDFFTIYDRNSGDYYFFRNI